MSLRRTLTLLALFFALTPQLLRSEPSLDVVVSKQKIPLEDMTTLTIQVSWSKAEGRYTFAFPKLQLKNLSIEQHGESQETFLQAGEEWVRKTFLITLKPEKIGEGKIDGFILHYIDPSTQKGGSFTVSPQTVTITRPQWKASPYLVIILLAGAAGVTIFLISYFLWPGHHRKQLEPEKIPSSSEKALDSLKNTLLLKGEKSYKDLLHEMSIILRRFIGDHYQIPVGQMTDHELLANMRKNAGVSRQEADIVQKLFDQLHEAKFTGTTLTDREVDHLARNLTVFIEGKQIVGKP
ncbi:MAG TPA: hypothetical protein VD913_04415 [bacterium]|nr:hypothetical protein [bacterium]